MTSVENPVSVGARLGAQGRVVLPALVREAAGLEEGVSFIVHAEGEGRVVLETREAARARVRAAAPQRADRDTVADIRAVREEDAAIADAAFTRRRQAATTADPATAAEIGASLLRHLGLA